MPTDTAFLQPVYAHAGPFATAYLDTGREAEDAAHAIALRWRGLREDLEGAGADRSVLEAMDSVVGTRSRRPGDEGQLVVGADGAVALDERLPRPPDRDLARWEPLPDLLPLLRASAPVIPYLLVKVDRTGADVEAYSRLGAEGDHETVVGDDFPIHKVNAGGWSHRRYQQRAENTWERNASDVAERVAKLSAGHGARVVVVVGDVRARAALRDHASAQLRPLLVDLEEGSRSTAAGGVDKGVADVLAERARADDAAVLEAFRQELGRGERAVSGLAPTAHALRRGQVETLVLADGAGPAGRLWVGADPLALATGVGELHASGVEEPVEVRADAALLRAAAATDAAVQLVEPGAGDVADGVGALLRYALP